MQRSKINNKISQQQQINIEQTDQAFFNYIIYFLSQPKLKNFKTIKSLFQKLREKNINILKKIVMDSNKLQNLIEVSQDLNSISIIMHQHHLYYQVDTFNYGAGIFKLISAKIKKFIDTYSIDFVFGCHLVEQFLIFKNNNKSTTKNTKITIQQIKQFNQQTFFTIQFLINPFLIYGFKYVKQPEIQKLAIIFTKWLVFCNDFMNLTRAKLLIDLSTLILNKVCPTLSNFNNILSVCFTNILDWSSLAYHDQDPFQVSQNIFLFINKLNVQTLQQLVQVWYQSIQPQNFGKQTFQNVMINLISGNNHFNCLKIIDFMTKHLISQNQYQILFHLYNKVIKVVFVKSIYLKQQQFRLFLDIIMSYTVGFINMDRMQGELEIIVVNYWAKLMKIDINQISRQQTNLIKLLQICENRFKNSTKITRNMVRQLKKIFRTKIDIVQIYKIIQKGMFAIKANQQSDFNQQSIKSSNRYLGLSNLGNTCYINSFVQTLYMTKKFRQFIENQSLKKENQTSPSHVLSQLFTQLSKHQYSRQNHIVPFKFKKFLPQPFASSKDQQDTTEFGRLYFDYLLNDLKKTGQNNGIQDLFFNITRLTLTCTKCQTINKIEQKIFDFILSFEQTTTQILLSDLLLSYFNIQNFVQDNLIYCDKCKQNTKKTAQLYPINFAPYMAITLNRFRYDHSKKCRGKLLNKIQFEFQLDLRHTISHLASCRENCKYELYAFIVHIGRNAQGGHYVAYARNIQENANLWYIFDDSCVTQHQISTSAQFNLGQNDTPYMLFYSSESGKKISVPNY